MSGLEINGSLQVVGDLTISVGTTNIASAEIINIGCCETINVTHAEHINVGACHSIEIEELNNLDFKYRDVALRILAQIKIAHNISNHELGLKCAEVRIIIDQGK